MDKITQILNWLNGKKTLIGSALLFAAFTIEKVVGGIWSVDGQTFSNIIETLQWVGGVLTGIGFTHKGMKAMSPK